MKLHTTSVATARARIPRRATVRPPARYGRKSAEHGLERQRPPRFAGANFLFLVHALLNNARTSALLALVRYEAADE